MASEGLLRGHTALITGASKGIGKAIAVGFAEQGANVILVARKRAGMAEVAEACRAAGDGTVELQEMDAGDRESVTALARAVEGKVTVLVNNAGIVAGSGQPPLENDPDDWDAMLAVNLAAPMRLLRLLGPSMAAQPDALVINISSVDGLYARPLAVGYAASKFSESMADALKGRIRVTTIFPAFVATEMTQGLKRFEAEEMLTTRDILEAALLPFRVSKNACPTRIVLQNAVRPRE